MSWRPATCPYCGFAECEAEFVHNGVGMQQVTPYYCGGCGAYEIGPYDRSAWRALSDREKRTGWYEPPPEDPKERANADSRAQRELTTIDDFLAD